MILSTSRRDRSRSSADGPYGGLLPICFLLHTAKENGEPQGATAPLNTYRREKHPKVWPWSSPENPVPPQLDSVSGAETKDHLIDFVKPARFFLIDPDRFCCFSDGFG